VSPGLLLYNPAAGGGGRRAELARRACELLSTGGIVVEPMPTAGPGHASELVEERLRRLGVEEAGDLLVLGGDGTLNEAVTGALRAGVLQAGGPGPCFGVVPAGTANVIARDLGLPRHPLRAAAALAGGAARPFDVGTCRGPAGERPFLLAAGVGVEAEVIAAVDPAVKRRFGPAAFLAAGWRVAGARDRALRVRARLADGREVERLVAGSLTCGNSRLYGGPCRLSRRAAHDDGVLELLLVRSTARPALLALGLASRFADASHAPGVELLPVVSVSVEAPAAVPVHVDAELFGTTPVELGVLPRALRLRVPS
jgi:diacylglycerol kinase family enzyme